LDAPKAAGSCPDQAKMSLASPKKKGLDQPQNDWTRPPYTKGSWDERDRVMTMRKWVKTDPKVKWVATCPHRNWAATGPKQNL